MNAAAMLGVGLVQRSIGLVLIAVLSRVLDPKGLGALTFVQSTSNTFAGLSRLGADAGVHVVLAGLKLPAEKARAEAVLGQALTLFLLVAVGVAVSMVVLAGPIAGWLFALPDLAPFVIVAAALLLGQTMSQYCYTIYAGLHAFPGYSRIASFTSIISAALVVVGALMGGAWGAAISLGAGQIVAMAILVFGIREEADRRGITLRPHPISTEMSVALKIGLPFYLSGLLVIPAEFASFALLSRAAGVEALGDLRLTQTLMSAATVIPLALSGPLISHLAEHNARFGSSEALHLQLKAVWILALLIAVGLAAVWPFAVDVLFGGQYTLVRSKGALAIASFVPAMILTVLTGGLLASRKSGALLLVGGIQAAILVFAVWLSVDAFGLSGILISQAISMGAASITAGVAVWLALDRSFPKGWMLLLALMTAALILLLVLDVTLILRPIARIGIAVGFALLLVLTAIAALTSEERGAMLRYARLVFTRMTRA